jgi:hypothetical protein
MELNLRTVRRAAWLNLVLPGGGLVLIGAVWSGMLAGLAFAACANFTLGSILLFPDDFSRGTLALGIGLTAGSYLGTQWRLARIVRERAEQAAASRRRQVLADAERLLRRGEAGQAAEELAGLGPSCAGDLAVAYRLAQALTAAGNTEGALGAWEAVRRLDKHGIYREHVNENERRLRQCSRSG